MARLLPHADAEADLRELGRSQLKLATRLAALITEVGANRELLDMLTVHGFGTDERELFQASRWLEFWQDGKDLWRLKFWELEHQGQPYRVIYALKRGTGDHYVLAGVHRDFNYDPDHPTTHRILRAYEDI